MDGMSKLNLIDMILAFYTVGLGGSISIHYYLHDSLSMYGLIRQVLRK